MIQEQKKYFNWDTISSTSSNTSVGGSNNSSNQNTGVTGKAVTDAEFKTFKTNLAQRLAFPLTSEISRFLDAWRRAENTNATYNPFATTWPGKNKTSWSKDAGMTQFNSAGVKRFSNIDAGIEATIDTLNQSYYVDLMSQLRRPDVTAEELAVNPDLRKWGTTSSNPNLIKSLLQTSSDTIDDIDIETQTSLLDDLIYKNKQVLWVWRQWYNALTLRPENYLWKFKGVVNDEEQEAVDWIYDQFNNKTNHARLLDEYKIWCNKNQARLPECAYVLSNINNIQVILGPGGIPKLILSGEEGRVTDEFTAVWAYNPVEKKWKKYNSAYPFKWNYF